MVTFMDGIRVIKNERISIVMRLNHGTGDISERRWQLDSNVLGGLLLNMSGFRRLFKEGNILYFS